MIKTKYTNYYSSRLPPWNSRAAINELNVIIVTMHWVLRCKNGSTSALRECTIKREYTRKHTCLAAVCLELIKYDIFANSFNFICQVMTLGICRRNLLYKIRWVFAPGACGALRFFGSKACMLQVTIAQKVQWLHKQSLFAQTKTN